MKNSTAGFRQLVSFIAGVMIGSSIMIPVLVVTAESWARWQTFGWVGAIILLVAGLVLQSRSSP